MSSNLAQTPEPATFTARGWALINHRLHGYPSAPRLDAECATLAEAQAAAEAWLREHPKATFAWIIGPGGRGWIRDKDDNWHEPVR